MESVADILGEAIIAGSPGHPLCPSRGGPTLPRCDSGRGTSGGARAGPRRYQVLRPRAARRYDATLGADGVGWEGGGGPAQAPVGAYAMVEADVIVVGGGPAGGMAAWRLGPACRVVLLERARLPRDKLCSGVLTRKSVEQLRVAIDLEPVLIGQAEAGIRVTHGARGVFIAPTAWPLLFASRARMDQALLEAAARRGADVRERAAVVAVDAERGEVALAGGGRLRGRLVIGADGATGVCALAVQGALPRAGVALEARIVDPRPTGQRWAILDSRLPGGYFWAFPKWDGSVAIGGGTMRPTAGRGLRGAVAAWAARVAGARLPERVRGHPVPCYGPRRAQAGRVLLTGDAAGLIDPLLGEGIPFALWSGRLAAEHALACLGGRAEPRGYGVALSPLLAWQRPFRALLPQADLLRRALSHRRVVGMGWRILVERVPPVLQRELAREGGL